MARQHPLPAEVVEMRNVIFAAQVVEPFLDLAHGSGFASSSQEAERLFAVPRETNATWSIRDTAVVVEESAGKRCGP